MSSQHDVVNASNAASFIGQTVLMELVWEQDPEPIWRCFHILGFVLPIEGIYEHGYFLTMDFDGKSRYPDETFFSSIRTIRAMRHRDRHGSGNVLGCIAHPNSAESGAALPARRNSSTVPSNGSTGAAHP